MDERIQQYVDEVTAGLAADPELRLDVKAELATHLERTCEEMQAEDGEDATTRALKVFGSQVELAGEMLEGNKRRMRWRALMRLTLQSLVIPAAILLAVLIGYGGLVRITDLWRMMNRFYTPGTDFTIVAGNLPHLPGTIPPEKRLQHVLQKIPNTTSKDRLLSLTASDLKDKATAGYLFASGNSAIDSVENDPRQAGYIDLTKLEKEVRACERLDPDNALYNYTLAQAYFSQSVGNSFDLDNSGIAQQGHLNTPAVFVDEFSIRDERGKAQHNYFKVTDRALYEKGLEELKRGLAKPELESYRTTMANRRLALLPKPTRLDDYVMQLDLLSSELLPEYARYREFVRLGHINARYALAHGRKDDALTFLTTGARLSQQLLKHKSTFLIELLVVRALEQIELQYSGDLLQQLGHPELLDRTKRLASAFDQAVKSRRTPQTRRMLETTLASSGSTWAAIFSPVLLPKAYINNQRKFAAALAPSRYLDQTIIEQLGASVLLLALTVVMFATILRQWGWHFRLRAAKGAPLLLLPSLVAYMRIFALGILLPLALYVVYSRWSGLAGREIGTKILLFRMIGELSLLVLALIIAPTVLAVRAVRRRCLALQVPVPGKDPAWHRTQFRLGLIAVGLMICCIALPIIITHQSLLPVYEDWMPGAWLGLAVLTLIAVLLLLVRWLLKALKEKPMEYALYHGTVARSLVPIYALAIILIAGLTVPYLTAREKSLLRQDHLIFGQGQQFALSPLEGQVVNEMHEDMVAAMKQAER